MSSLEELLASVEIISRKLDPTEEQARSMTLEVQEFVLDALKGSKGGDNGDPPDPAWRYSGPTAAQELEESGLHEQPAESMTEVLGLVDRNVLKEGGNHSSSRFFGWVPGGAMYPAALGDYLVASSARFAGYWLANPGAVRMENLLIKWVTEIVAGYDTSKSMGFLASGASLATVSAIVCARDAHKVLTNTDIPANQHVVYTSSQVHGCAQKALWLVGCCTVRIRYVKVDDACRIIPSDLEKHLIQDEAAGLTPWLVIANAGTVNTGSVDPLEAIGVLAKKHKCWYHIDGAYGALLKLCPEGADVMKGTELSDSMVADPHKALFVPQGTGIVMVKNGQQLKDSHTLSAHYLQPFAETPGDVVASSAIGPELTKHFRAMRLWLPLKLFGIAPFRAAQTEKILLARYFVKELRRKSEEFGVPFMLGPDPELSIATYRLQLPDSDSSGLEATNQLNQDLLQAVLKDGSCFITLTQLPDEFIWLRLCVLQFRSHRSDVDQLIKVLLEQGRACCARVK